MFFLMSDIHGCYDQFEEMLKNWNKEEETLVLLGDYVDRGPNSLGVVKKVKELKTKYGDRVIVLKGNHDDQFCDWVYSGEDASFYFYDDLRETLKSFYVDSPKKYHKDSRKQKAQYVLKHYREEISFLKRLPLYHETEHCIFVHAGIRLNSYDWRKEDENTFLWIREDFYHSKITSEKKVFFGHTPTFYMNNEKGNNDIWISKYKDKIGIDGACFFGGQLNGVKIDKEGNIIETIQILNKK